MNFSSICLFGAHSVWRGLTCSLENNYWKGKSSPLAEDIWDWKCGVAHAAAIFPGSEVLIFDIDSKAMA